MESNSCQEIPSLPPVNISLSSSDRSFFALLLFVRLPMCQSLQCYRHFNCREFSFILPSRLLYLREKDDDVRAFAWNRRGVVGSLERGSSEVFYWEFVCFSCRPFISSQRRFWMPLLWFVKIRSGSFVIGWVLSHIYWPMIPSHLLLNIPFPLDYISRIFLNILGHLKIGISIFQPFLLVKCYLFMPI